MVLTQSQALPAKAWVHTCKGCPGREACGGAVLLLGRKQEACCGMSRSPPDGRTAGIECVCCMPPAAPPAAAASAPSAAGCPRPAAVSETSCCRAASDNLLDILALSILANGEMSTSAALYPESLPRKLPLPSLLHLQSAASCSVCAGLCSGIDTKQGCSESAQGAGDVVTAAAVAADAGATGLAMMPQKGLLLTCCRSCSGSMLVVVPFRIGSGAGGTWLMFRVLFTGCRFSVW